MVKLFGFIFVALLSIHQASSLQLCEQIVDVDHGDLTLSFFATQRMPLGRRFDFAVSRREVAHSAGDDDMENPGNHIAPEEIMNLNFKARYSIKSEPMDCVISPSPRRDMIFSEDIPRHYAQADCAMLESDGQEQLFLSLESTMIKLDLCTDDSSSIIDVRKLLVKDSDTNKCELEETTNKKKKKRCNDWKKNGFKTPPEFDKCMTSFPNMTIPLNLPLVPNTAFSEIQTTFTEGLNKNVTRGLANCGDTDYNRFDGSSNQTGHLLVMFNNITEDDSDASCSSTSDTCVRVLVNVNVWLYLIDKDGNYRRMLVELSDNKINRIKKKAEALCFKQGFCVKPSSLLSVSASSPPPSQSPTQSPTRSPSRSPSRSPTQSPSQSPTQSPSRSPTQSPTRSPTQSPSRSPTQSPSRSPTQSPSQSPTQSPSQSPSSSPSQSPTRSASSLSSPSRSPSSSPSASASSSPSASPSSTGTIVSGDTKIKAPVVVWVAFATSGLLIVGFIFRRKRKTEEIFYESFSDERGLVHGDKSGAASMLFSDDELSTFDLGHDVHSCEVTKCQICMNLKMGALRVLTRTQMNGSNLSVGPVVEPEDIEYLPSDTLDLLSGSYH